MRNKSVTHIAGAALVAMFAAGCGGKPQQGGMPPQEVDVIRARAESLPLTRDLVGRLSATRAADVRARVAGVLLKRLYKEGSDVKEGQVLFLIDPAPLKAAYQASEAALAQAEANATNAHVLAERYRNLVNTGAVSKSDVDNAEANERSTAAAVQQARANVETARINLGYATVRAPISGRSGQQRVTEGALVGQGEATLLTTIEQVDPIYVNFDQPASEVQRLRRLHANGNITLLERNQARVEVLLSDGTVYPHDGTLDFSDVSVDPTTGALAYRGILPNPERQLLPGLYVNVRVTLGELNRAIRVPQIALQRDANGPFVLTVGADNKVVQKRIAADDTVGSDWIATAGIDSGDLIIVSGLQRAQPGSVVKPVERQAVASPAPAAGATPPAAQY